MDTIYRVNVEIGSDYLTISDGAGEPVFGPAGLATTRAASPTQIRRYADSLLRSQGWERTTRWDSNGRSFYATVKRKG